MAGQVEEKMIFFQELKSVSVSLGCDSTTSTQQEVLWLDCSWNRVWLFFGAPAEISSLLTSQCFLKQQEVHMHEGNGAVLGVVLTVVSNRWTVSV